MSPVYSQPVLTIFPEQINNKQDLPNAQCHLYVTSQIFDFKGSVSQKCLLCGQPGVWCIPLHFSLKENGLLLYYFNILLLEDGQHYSI